MRCKFPCHRQSTFAGNQRRQKTTKYFSAQKMPNWSYYSLCGTSKPLRNFKQVLGKRQSLTFIKELHRAVK